MSRIGKVPIQIPAGTQAHLDQNGTLNIKGPKGELKFTPHSHIEVKVGENSIVVKRKSNEKFDRSLHGLTRSLIANMIEGTNKGYAKQLVIQGVGYKADVQGKKITFSLGYSHPIHVTVPEGLTVEQDKEKKNILTISGIDKQLVGDFAAKIRRYRPPEPYKGKGIRYKDEHIIRKAGKTAAAKTSASGA